MTFFDNLTSECREKFIDMTSEFLEFIEKKGYEEESFVNFKKSINPNFDLKLYASTMNIVKKNQEKLLNSLQENLPISDYFIDSVKEGCIGAIIRKITDLEKQTNEDIKNSLKSIIDIYKKTFKKYFPDDNSPESIIDFYKNRKSYNVDPRL